MRIVYLSAGAGAAYCGACNQDVSLVRALLQLGHAVELLPLYTPLTVDGEVPGAGKVFYGGINAFLQQKSVFFRRSPRWVDAFLDRPAFLRWASSFAITTRPAQLGPMTVSVLQGEEGRQRKELRKLIAYLKTIPRPDLFVLTNSMLSGIAPALKEAFSRPVACHLQGEEEFLNALPAPFRGKAIEALHANTAAIDGFVSPCEDYARVMAAFLKVDGRKIRVVHPGVDDIFLDPAQPPRGMQDFRVGYLSRIEPAKGLMTLVEGFSGAAAGKRPMTLAIAGRVIDKAYFRGCREALARAGLKDRWAFTPTPDLRAKKSFLNGLNIICLPSRIYESRGVAALEALACGVTVVAPNRGIFPEIAQKTGGLNLLPPDDAGALSSAIAKMAENPEGCAEQGRAGRRGVAEHFSAERRAVFTLEAYAALGRA